MRNKRPRSLQSSGVHGSNSKPDQDTDTPSRSCVDRRDARQLPRTSLPRVLHSHSSFSCVWRARQAAGDSVTRYYSDYSNLCVFSVSTHAFRLPAQRRGTNLVALRCTGFNNADLKGQDHQGMRMASSGPMPQPGSGSTTQPAVAFRIQTIRARQPHRPPAGSRDA